MSLFGTKAAEANYDGLSIPALDPAKYEKVKLTNVVFEKLKKQDGSEGKWAIKFFFTTPEGLVHQHTEYEIVPNVDDKWESKLKNEQIRIGHIMSKFIPKDQLSQESETYEAYGNWVVAKLNSVPYKEVELDMLVTGNVYGGKATSAFTGYPPFLAKHGESLQFDNNGMAANKAYYAFKEKQSGSATPDQESTSGGVNTSQSPKADF